MGRSGIAMTFVTDQELKALKSLLEMNRIDPVWHGSIPDLRTVARRNGRRNGKKYVQEAVPASSPPSSLQLADAKTRPCSIFDAA